MQAILKKHRITILWKILILHFIASLLAGVPIKPNKMQPQLHANEKLVQLYLQAYSYANEQPAVAKIYLKQAKDLLPSCTSDCEELTQRILRLQTRL